MEKHDGKKKEFKARLVARGFQEKDKPWLESPTIAKESLKTFLAIAANKGFDIINLDIRNGYLQGGELKREVLLNHHRSTRPKG